MRIVCPYVPGLLHDETRRCLDWSGFKAEYVDVGDGVTAYARLIGRLWGECDSFVIVEQDMAFETEQLAELVDCPEPYCAFPYEWETNIGPALGFTKFGAEVIAAAPNVGAAIRVLDHRQLDYVLMRTILGRVRHLQPHLHLPPVRHLNPLKSPLRPEFQHLSLDEHLAALGWWPDEIGRHVYVGGPEFGPPMGST